MNNIITNFSQIMDFAAKYGLPPGKKRAIVREYLQVKILCFVYDQKMSKKIFFTGGTSLRLLRGLDRFSEDLDFDLQKIGQDEITGLVNSVIKRLSDEAIDTVLYRNTTAKRAYFEIRFPDLLYNLGISGNKEEKLNIKLDFETFWKTDKPQNILLTRYGETPNVLTLPLSQILVQKLTAYLGRKQTQPRDIYDLVWLKSQEAVIDRKFLSDNNIDQNIITLAIGKFRKEERHLGNYKTKLKPFLIHEDNVNKLDLFPEIINKSSLS